MASAPPVRKDPAKAAAGRLGHVAKGQPRIIDIRDLNAAERRLIHALIDAARASKAGAAADEEGSDSE